MPKILRKSMVMKSRTEKPYFQYKQDELNYQVGDALGKVLYFSVDPVMKTWLGGAKTSFRKVQIGDIFNCFGLAQIIQQNEIYSKGTYLFGNVGTTNYAIINQSKLTQCFPVPQELVKMYGEQNFLYIMNNGLAAYAGYEILSPEPNSSVLVSTAGGATGLLFCQLLKKNGHKVIGLTSKKKLSFIEKYTDIAVDYQNRNQLLKALDENQFKYYFDNVGQWLLDLVLTKIQKNGRICIIKNTQLFKIVLLLFLIIIKLFQIQQHIIAYHHSFMWGNIKLFQF